MRSKCHAEKSLPVGFLKFYVDVDSPQYYKPIRIEGNRDITMSVSSFKFSV
jgi:hypothetical protein